MIKESITDPDCGVCHKGDHKKVFAYLSNTACDKNNFVLAFEVTAGNLNNSTVFPILYKGLKENHEHIQNIVLDAGYKTPALGKLIIDDGKILIMPYKRPMTKQGFFKKYDIRTTNIMIVTYVKIIKF